MPSTKTKSAAFDRREEKFKSHLLPPGIKTDARAWLYFEEARTCWGHGAFAAAGVMAREAFLELLKARILNGTVKKAPSFSFLVSKARKMRLLNAKEERCLQDIERYAADPYSRFHINRRRSVDRLSKIVYRSALTEMTDYSGGERRGSSSMEILLELFPKFSRRFFN